MEFSGPRGILLSFAIYYAATQDWSEVSFYAQKNYRNCVHKATRYFRSPFVFGSVNRVAIPEITKTQRFAHYDFKAPFMLKGALGNSKALSWADKELAESPLANDTLVNVGYRRSAEDFRITFREFLRTYKGTDLLLMSLIPEYLRSDIRLPFPFSCPNVNQCIRSLNLRWIDQGNAKFSNHHVHHDDTLTLNCLIKGRKVFTTVDYVKYGHLNSQSNASPLQIQTQNEVLKLHNEYRRTHKTGPLKLTIELNKLAQEYADKLASDAGGLSHRTTEQRRNTGENLYYTAGSRARTDQEQQEAGKSATDAWYGEIEKYDFNKPGFGSGTGHFTQLLWAESKSLGVGIGISADKKKIYVVANYDPAGNVAMSGDGGASYRKNVLPVSG